MRSFFKLIFLSSIPNHFSSTSSALCASFTAPGWSAFKGASWVNWTTNSNTSVSKCIAINITRVEKCAEGGAAAVWFPSRYFRDGTTLTAWNRRIISGFTCAMLGVYTNQTECPANGLCQLDSVRSGLTKAMCVNNTTPYCTGRCPNDALCTSSNGIPSFDEVSPIVS